MGNDLAMAVWKHRNPKFRYMMLDRLRQDCDYYIRNNFKTGNSLWAGDPRRQIETMKAIWLTFWPDDTPEWLTWEQILDYAKKMGVDSDD